MMDENKKQVKIVESPWRNNTSFNLEFRDGSRLRWAGTNHSFSARFYSEVEARTYAEHFGFEVVESFPVLSAPTDLESLLPDRFPNVESLQTSPLGNLVLRQVQIVPNEFGNGRTFYKLKYRNNLPVTWNGSPAQFDTTDAAKEYAEASKLQVVNEFENSPLTTVWLICLQKNPAEYSLKFENGNYLSYSPTGRIARFPSKCAALDFANHVGLTFIDHAPRAKVVGDLSVTIDSEAKMVYRVELETGSFLSRGIDAIDVFTSIDKAEAFAKGLGYEVVDCFEEVPQPPKSPPSKEST